MVEKINFKPHHTALIVRDLAASIRFYKTLDFEEVYRYTSEESNIILVNLMLDGYILELIWYATNSKKDRLPNLGSKDKGVGVEHFGLKVDNIEKAYQNLVKLGLVTANTEIQNGRTNVRYFFIQDPDGIRVEIVEDDRFS